MWRGRLVSESEWQTFRSIRRTSHSHGNKCSKSQPPRHRRLKFKHHWDNVTSQMADKGLFPVALADSATPHKVSCENLVRSPGEEIGPSGTQTSPWGFDTRNPISALPQEAVDLIPFQLLSGGEESAQNPHAAQPQVTRGRPGCAPASSAPLTQAPHAPPSPSPGPPGVRMLSVGHRSLQPQANCSNKTSAF